MICNRCGNKKEFTMIREIAYWNDEKKKFEDATAWDEYYICDNCAKKHEVDKDGVVFIDTEGDY